MFFSCGMPSKFINEKGKWIKCSSFCSLFAENVAERTFSFLCGKSFAFELIFFWKSKTRKHR
jgi:hypothetical protein